MARKTTEFPISVDTLPNSDIKLSIKQLLLQKWTNQWSLQQNNKLRDAEESHKYGTRKTVWLYLKFILPNVPPNYRNGLSHKNLFLFFVRLHASTLTNEFVAYVRVVITWILPFHYSLKFLTLVCKTVHYRMIDMVSKIMEFEARELAEFQISKSSVRSIKFMSHETKSILIVYLCRFRILNFKFLYQCSSKHFCL